MKEVFIIMQILNLFKSWFTPNPKDRNEPAPDEKGELIAICVGHSRAGDNGAISLGGISEWVLNSALAIKIRRALQRKGYRVVVIDSYAGKTYPQAMRWLAAELQRLGASFAVELHFNSFDEPIVEGFEFLYWHRSIASRDAAKIMTATHKANFREFSNRGAKPVERKGRGALFLRLTPCPAVIAEPYFGSNHREWEFYSANQAKLADSLAEGIGRYADEA